MLISTPGGWIKPWFRRRFFGCRLKTSLERRFDRRREVMQQFFRSSGPEAQDSEVAVLILAADVDNWLLCEDC